MLTNKEVLGVEIKKPFSDNGFRPDHVFAAIAVRVSLEIGVGEASELLAMEAVRSHMRILEAVVSNNCFASQTDACYSRSNGVEQFGR